MSKSLLGVNDIEDIVNRLLTHTASLINHVYWVKQKFDILPDHDHIGMSINYVDLKEFRNEFLNELVNTICEWVYSNKKAMKIIDEFIKEDNRSILNAQSALRTLAFSKFRKIEGQDVYSQGQFGELLLFNFIQHFFHAVPLLRKMAITTSEGHERFGADAIHYKYENDKNIIILGESKVYKSDYQFKNAFEKSLESILSTYNKHTEELNLYLYDDFLDDDLVPIAKSYKQGKLKNVEVQLVCLIAYNETKTIDKVNEMQIKKEIVNIIEERCNSLEKEIFKCISSEGLLPRMNYLIFPVWNLEDLLINFQRLIGR
ncbi:DUF1837 domain-containing protein [Anoxybacteroides tepidamans]|uniref:HamA C-terminal domain-containing protein n=1 Tax=Anoxybacteroides tepidamans TaxID=265948 RepID=UPI0006884EE7|nr:DUF1837 domain-containing protein [Anoxybacillus tepidamans]